MVRRPSTAGGDGYGGGEHAVGEQRRAAEHGGDDEPLAEAAHDAVEREDAAFAAVVGLERDEHVLYGGEQRHRPDDERERAEHELLGDAHDAAVAGKERFRDVHGRGADIAVDNADGDEHGAEAHRDGVRLGMRGAFDGLGGTDGFAPASALAGLFGFLHAFERDRSGRARWGGDPVGLGRVFGFRLLDLGLLVHFVELLESVFRRNMPFGHYSDMRPYVRGWWRFVEAAARSVT